jgi:hypothetical protein
MKYLLTIFILLSISTHYFAEYDCEKGEGEIETVNKIEGKVLKTITLENKTEFIFCETNLCEDYGFPVLLYIKKNNKIYRSIQLTEVGLQEKQIHQPTQNYYYFDCYTGGNSINAEYRKALLIEDNNGFYFAGFFTGYEDIDEDNVKDFFIFKEFHTESAHVDWQYKKAKMILKNNILTMPNSKNP